MSGETLAIVVLLVSFFAMVFLLWKIFRFSSYQLSPRFATAHKIFPRRTDYS